MSSTLEITRVVLALLLVVANVFVWRGVVLEGDSYPSETKERGWRMLVRALAAEAALAFILFCIDTTLNLIQRREILALEAEIEPRRLTLEQQQKLATFASSLDGQSIRVASYALDAESAVLCEQIVRAFAAGGPKTLDRCASESTLGGFALAIHVTGDNQEAAKKLLGAFASFGLLVTPTPVPPATGISLGGQDAPAAARVFVGIKPIAQ